MGKSSKRAMSTPPATHAEVDVSAPSSPPSTETASTLQLAPERPKPVATWTTTDGSSAAPSYSRTRRSKLQLPFLSSALTWVATLSPPAPVVKTS